MWAGSGRYYFLADWPGATPDPLRNPSPQFISFPEVGTYPAEWFKREQLGFSGGSSVKTVLPLQGAVGSICGQEAKTPYVSWPKKQGKR